MSNLSSEPSYELSDSVTAATKRLPPLPPLIRYKDEFHGVTRTIVLDEALDTFEFQMDGLKRNIDLSVFGAARNLFKHLVVDWFHHLAPRSAIGMVDDLRSFVRKVGLSPLLELTVSTPADVSLLWDTRVLPNCTTFNANTLKRLLHSCCDLSFGEWGREGKSIITALRGVRADKKRVVRLGDCFVPFEDQAKLVNYFDAITAHQSQGHPIEFPQLTEACILILNHQYGLRPGQIALTETNQVRVFPNGSVHLTIPFTKQRSGNQQIFARRRIKREWAPLFIELFDQRKKLGPLFVRTGRSHLLFGLTPPEIGDLVTELTGRLLGDSWTPTDLRHTAAQRMADAGLARTALAEFMTHESITAADVYYIGSPTQAQRVNEALAISPVYSNVAKVARTKLIDKSILLAMPPDNQIGGIPHGIPISGIGGCELGQSLCTKNPVLSCYGCNRFLPVTDASVHIAVLTQMRPVVNAFASASRNNETSPAYAQLKSTLQSVRHVAETITKLPEDEKS